MKQIITLLLGFVILSSSSTKSEVKMEGTTNKKVGTIELVIFKIKDGVSHDEFVESAKLVNPIVEKFDGYIGRKLAVDKEGTWSDIVYWTDQKSAELAAEEVMKSPVCQKFFEMIDQESMQFMHMDPVINE